MKPEKLYRYLSFGNNDDERAESIQYLKAMLLEGNFYFQCPANFNDPFDCKSNLYFNLLEKKAYESFYRDFRNAYPQYGHVGATRKIKEFLDDPHLLRKGQQSINDELNQNLQTCGIMCLSATLFNVLLWAHYANGHKGYCIVFYKDRLIQFAKSIGRLKKIKYQKSYPLIRYFGGDPLNKILKTVFTKCSDWKYEQEWRFFIPSITNRIIQIPRNCLVSIYLGARIDKQDEIDVFNIVKQMKPKLSVFKMNISNTRYAAYSKRVL